MLREWLIYDNIILSTLITIITFLITWLWYKAQIARPLSYLQLDPFELDRARLLKMPFLVPRHLPLALLLYAFIWLLCYHSFFLSIPVPTPFWNYGIRNRTGMFYWLFYISTIITLFLFNARVKHGGISLNTIAALALLLFFISMYFNLTNVIATVFVIECQSIALLLFLVNSTEFLKKTGSQVTARAHWNAQGGWRINILMIQFWINFFGATALILFSLIISGYVGTTRFIDLKLIDLSLPYFGTSPLFATWIYVWFISGLLLKTNAFPFHFWKPELYKSLPYPQIFIYAGLYTFLFLTLTIFFFKLIFIFNSQYLYFTIWATSVLTAIFLTPIFFKLTDIKLFIAYTSVFHVMYILVGVINTQHFAQFAMNYNIIYYITILTFFSTIFLFKSLKIKSLTDFQVITYSPTILFWLIASIASMAGLPPFLGFWSKFIILLSLWARSEFFLVGLLFSCSLILMYFYFANYRFAGTINLVRRTHYLSKINAPSIIIIGCVTAFLNIYGIGLINDLLNYTLILNDTL